MQSSETVGRPLRNRVLPTGEIVADPARGTLTGNRGILVHPDGCMMDRQWAARAWITCELEFRGRRRPLAQPHTWTELFFLDEAVAIAAGHRPCAYCRRDDYKRFKSLFPGDLKATGMDVVLHAERLDGRTKRRHRMQTEDLPDGAMIERDGTAYLVWKGYLHPYTPNGYSKRVGRPKGPTWALTPPSLLEVLSAGYSPKVHPSATF